MESLDNIIETNHFEDFEHIEELLYIVRMAYQELIASSPLTIKSVDKQIEAILLYGNLEPLNDDIENPLDACLIGKDPVYRK